MGFYKIYNKISKRLRRRRRHHGTELNRPIMNQFLNHLFNIILFQSLKRLMGGHLHLTLFHHRRRRHPFLLRRHWHGGFLQRRHVAPVKLGGQICREEFKRRIGIVCVEGEIGSCSRATHEPGGSVVGSGCIFGRFESAQPNSGLPAKNRAAEQST